MSTERIAEVEELLVQARRAEYEALQRKHRLEAKLVSTALAAAQAAGAEDFQLSQVGSKWNYHHTLHIDTCGKAPGYSDRALNLNGGFPRGQEYNFNLRQFVRALTEGKPGGHYRICACAAKLALTPMAMETEAAEQAHSAAKRRVYDLERELSGLQAAAKKQSGKDEALAKLADLLPPGTPLDAVLDAAREAIKNGA